MHRRKRAFYKTFLCVWMFVPTLSHADVSSLTDGIAVARAILKDAPILVMDEATSALDSRNELMIQKSLQSVIRGKTALIIAHRLSTLRNMDRIIVIKNGKIIESGSHQQLLRQNGVYKRLWNLQSAGFRDKK